MCYNPGISFAFFLIGAAATAYVHFVKPALPYKHVSMILGFYTLMELLQTIQYQFVNQCDRAINKALTEVAYVFVIVQPLLWNYFFYLNSRNSDKQVFAVGMAMATVWIVVNISSRVLYKPQNRIQSSYISGDKVCTKKKASHLFWEWTFADFGTFNANFLAHLMIWFIPALMTETHRMVGMILMLSALVGSLMAFVAGEMAIFASAWCYISVPIVLLIVYSVLLQSRH